MLIYFDDASRRLAAENLFENLAPGGFICLGHTESMSRVSSLFEVRRFADAIVYQRPREARVAEPEASASSSSTMQTWCAGSIAMRWNAQASRSTRP